MKASKVTVLNTQSINVTLPDGLIVTIDPVADILYIKIRDAEVSITEEKKEGVLVDVDKRGNLVGLEVLHPKKVSLERRRIFDRVARRYHIPSIRRVRPEHLAKGYELERVA